MEDESELVLRDERLEQSGEPREDRLVIDRRRRRHEQIATHQLVLVAVVGEPVKFVERPGLDGRRHVHDRTLLGSSRDACAEDTRACRAWRHRGIPVLRNRMRRIDPVTPYARRIGRVKRLKSE